MACEPDCSPAELVYGSTLRIPGEFVETTSFRNLCPTSTFLRNLQTTMQHALPPSAIHKNKHQPYLPKDLSSTGYVYIRVDKTRSPLERPYEGPFRIISKSDKYFTLDINGRSDKVSIDRLKTAFVGDNYNRDRTATTSTSSNIDQEMTNLHTTTTLFGRQTRVPTHLSEDYIAAVRWQVLPRPTGGG